MARFFKSVNKGSVQLDVFYGWDIDVKEWFIDIKGSNNQKMTLTMTIRSDSEYREAKQKGKLGAFTMLKLLYRG